MVSTTDVEYAYRLILGRDPENSEVVEKLAASSDSLTDLRKKFLMSAEFKNEPEPMSVLFLKPLNWERMLVDVFVSNEDLLTMMHYVEATWEELGRFEPHWSVLTHDKFRAASINENRSAFFASGEAAVRDLRASAERYGIPLDHFSDCFELGCGVGRVTTWLARLFPCLLASDISAPHLELAKQAMIDDGHRNIEFRKFRRLGGLKKNSQFDFFFFFFFFF